MHADFLGFAWQLVTDRGVAIVFGIICAFFIATSRLAFRLGSQYGIGWTLGLLVGLYFIVAEKSNAIDYAIFFVVIGVLVVFNGGFYLSQLFGGEKAA